MATRQRLDWKLDNQGQYARQIGWKYSRHGKRVQHKFRLGSDVAEARRREQRLVDLWTAIEAVATPAVWDSFTLEIAKQLAQGAVQIALSRHAMEAPAAYAERVLQVQKRYPAISFLPDDVASYATGLYEYQQVSRSAFIWDPPNPLEESRLPRVRLAMPPAAAAGSAVRGATLHEAMRAYIAWIEQDYYRPAQGGVTANGRMKMKQVEMLLKRHADITLSCLDYDAVEQMFRYWRQRPVRQGTERPISKKSAENYLSELRRFLRWLHRSRAYNWRKPDDFDEIETTVDDDPLVQQMRLAQVATFSLDELVLLSRYATPLERTCLLLALNCGFGVAEIATLRIGEVHLHQAHSARHQEILHYRTTAADSFIKRVRRKNGVYGEYLLFPQTVEAIQWVLTQREQKPRLCPESILLLNHKGEPYDKPTVSGNRNQQIPNRFADLIRRIRRDNNSIAGLSFNKLRKTAGDLIRQLSDGEVAGVFLCHGQPVKTDDLADVYTNRPFGKAFEALRRMQNYLQPVFEAAGPKPFSAAPRAYTRRKTLDRILEMHQQGKPIPEIAGEVRKSHMTVRRHIQRSERAQH